MENPQDKIVKTPDAMPIGEVPAGLSVAYKGAYVLIGVVILGTLLFIISKKFETGTDVTNRNPEIDVQIQNIKSTPSQDSSYASLQNNIAQIDSLVQQDSLTDTEKKELLLQKAYVSLVNRIDAAEMGPRDEAYKTFALVYESTLGASNIKDQQINNFALFGFIFGFAESCFSNATVMYIPKPIKKEYFNFVWGNKWKNSTTTEEWKKKQIFRGFVKFLDDDAKFPIYNSDVSFNGHSAYIKAMYLDSYKDSLTVDEKNSLITGITRDIEEYSTGRYTLFTEDSAHITLIAPLHIAFAKYAIKRATENISDYGIFDTLYKNTIQVDSDDSTVKDFVTGWALMYKLGGAVRAHASTTEITQVLDEMGTLTERNPAIGSIYRAYLSFGFHERGKWMDMKQDIFAFSKKSGEVKNFLDSIGLVGY